MTLLDFKKLSHQDLANLAFDKFHRVEALEQDLSWLKRQIFGTKSERFIPNELQTQLPLDTIEVKPVETKTTSVT